MISKCSVKGVCLPFITRITRSFEDHQTFQVPKMDGCTKTYISLYVYGLCKGKPTP